MQQGPCREVSDYRADIVAAYKERALPRHTFPTPEPVAVPVHQWRCLHKGALEQLPWARPTSALRNLMMICSAVNRFSGTSSSFLNPKS